MIKVISFLCNWYISHFIDLHFLSRRIIVLNISICEKKTYIHAKHAKVNI